MSVQVTKVKTNDEINSMRVSGKMLGAVLKLLKTKIEPGMSTKDIDRIAAEELKRLGGEPAFLGYQGFPATACISVNQEVVHGIPLESKIIQSGDIVSVDFGVVHRGMITDAAFSKIVGTPKDQAQEKLLKVTANALNSGIKTVRNSSMTGDIGAAVEKILNKNNLGIVRDLVGHGVGHNLHEEPNIPNYGKAGTGFKLQAGMTIAIEPMSTIGSPSVEISRDGWTVITRDGSLSAHFEHTILVTDNSYEILTAN